MGDEQKTLWVGSLPADVTEKEIRNTFQRCGHIDEVFVSRGREEQFLWGFVEFADNRGFDSAMRMREDELYIRDQLLKIKKGHRNHPARASQRGYGGWDDWRDKKDRWERHNRGHQHWDNNYWRKDDRRPSRYWRDAGGEDIPMKDQVKAGHENRRIHVGNLPEKVRRSEVEQHFQDFGNIQFISLKHKETESFCFIGFDSEKAAELAIQEMDRATIYGNQIKVSLSRPPHSSHRSVEYSEWGNEYHSPQRRHESNRSPGHEKSERSLVPNHSREESESSQEESSESYSEEVQDAPIPPGVSGLGATPVAATTDAPGDGHAVATVATDNGEEESGESSSSSDEDEEDKDTDRREGEALEATACDALEVLEPQLEPQLEPDGEERSRQKRRRRRKMDETGQPQRHLKRRKRRERGAAHATHTPAPATAPAVVQRQASRSRSAPRAVEPKPPLQRKRGPEQQGIRVRVENLPSDMNLEEFRNTGLDFGEVIEVKLWKTKDGSKTGHITFVEGTDVARERRSEDRVELLERSKLISCGHGAKASFVAV
ncbi:unnamed protein product [Cladocopium goreaui]|uniref:RRM domain-containing protein n=1 Tax=Cladocopium goreaui TaxID=2562237 RepID=A0A9P1GH63_9DINO|nr:unnamed protein product [Cladocopium goreaui]